ncbi:hypothetical protein ICN42_02100 [Polynucleobacter sp. 71A-WALBACH]|jgi:hypothetical protein|nr:MULTISPECIES: hypothetical protein [Polynucleobacter]MBU3592891.1 hypothetical protein [Polynucleobacter sp. 71A-WALBACH]MDH6154972.1 hypothetical protein [Polynucleobacter sphagniphilus]
MKTYQLTLRINGSEVMTIIYAPNPEQAKAIAHSWGATHILGMKEL